MGIAAAGGGITPQTWSSAGQLALNGFINSFSPSLTVPIGNFSFSLSPAFAFGEGGFSSGFYTSLSYSDSHVSLSLGMGQSNLYSGWNASAAYRGWGGGFGLTYYDEAIVRGNTLGQQTVGTISLQMQDVSFRLSNDKFGDKQDRWRTSAAELSVRNLTVGTYVTTNWGWNASNDQREDYPDPLLGYNPETGNGRGRAWRHGNIFSAPFWVGYRTGNSIQRIGYSHQYLQSLTQNAVHRYLVRTPFFTGTDNLYQGVYSSYGFNNPLSIW